MMELSRIGLGTVKFGRNQGVKYPTEFELPSDKVILELLQTAKELGINLLDTAPAYGTSEERLGKLLKDRDSWIICTKAGEEFENGKSYYDFSAKSITKSIERSLQRLKTNYLDIVLVHSNGEDKKIIEEDRVFETLEKLKQKGDIRSFGMSTKTVEGGKLTVDQADVVMVTYNPTYTEEKSVIEYAKQKNKKVFIKKALASGHEQDIQKAMQFIFNVAGVTSVILGTLSPAHLRFDVKCAEQALKEISY